MVKTIWIGDVQAGKYDDEEVELKGWIKRERGSNKMRFIVLRDSTGHIQQILSSAASLMNSVGMALLYFWKCAKKAPWASKAGLDSSRQSIGSYCAFLTS